MHRPSSLSAQRPTTAPCTAAQRWDLAPAQAQAEPASGNPSAQDYAFIALQNAYRPHAGLVRLHRLPPDGRIRSDRVECGVEDLVDAGALFGFQWHNALWIPMFQVDMPGPTVATGPQRVVAELGRGFDGWALASWFVQPNTWLANHSPIAWMGSRLPEVLEAARADRFVSTG